MAKRFIDEDALKAAQEEQDEKDEKKGKKSSKKSKKSSKKSSKKNSKDSKKKASKKTTDAYKKGTAKRFSRFANQPKDDEDEQMPQGGQQFGPQNARALQFLRGRKKGR